MSFLSLAFGKRAITVQDIFGKDASIDSFEGGSPTGVRVTPRRALQLMAYWSCVRLISGSIGAMPTGSFVRDGEIRKSVAKPRWMLQPNPEQMAIVFWEQVLTSLLIYGNTYVGIVRDRAFNVIELWVLHPDNVDPRRDGPRNRLQYHVRDEISGKQNILVPGTDIMHIPGFTLPGAVKGLNPIEYFQQALGLGLAAQEFGARFFGNGSTPSLAIEVDKSLEKEAAKRLALDFRRSHTGLRNSHLPVVLEGGAHVKPLTIPNDQAQFLETRGFQRSEIAGLFQVPPHMIGDVDRSTSWGSGIESQGIGFVVYCLGTWLQRVEQAANVLFPPESRTFMKFNVAGLLRGDVKSRFEAYNLGVTNGWLCLDEVRALEDMAPLPNGQGQVFRQPLNLGPAGDPTPGKDGK